MLSEVRVRGAVIVALALGCRPAAGPETPPPPPDVAEPEVVAGPVVRPRPVCSASPRAELQEREYFADHIELSPDGALLAYSVGGRTALLDVASGQRVAEVPGGGAVFSRDGALLLTARRAAIVRWRLPELVNDGEYAVPGGSLEDVTLARDTGEGRIVAFKAGSLHVWDAGTRRHVCSARDGAGALVLRGRTAWGCHERTLYAWDLESCEREGEWNLGDMCRDVDVTAEGGYVLAASIRALGVLNVATDVWRPALVRTQGEIRGMRALAGGRALLAGEGLLRVELAAAAARPLREASGWFPLLAVSGNGEVAVTLGELGDETAHGSELLQRWSPASDAGPTTFGAMARTIRPYHLAADGQTFSAAEGLRAGLFRVADGAPLRRFERAYAVNSAFSGDGSRFLVVEGQQLFVFDAHTGEPLATHASPMLMAPKGGEFAIDARGEHVFFGFPIGERRRHELLSVRTGERLSLQEPFPAPKVGTVFAEFSPDGAWVVSQVEGGLAVLWDMKTGTARREIGDGSQWFGRSPFSADGKRLIVHDEVGAAIVEVPGGKQAMYLQGIVEAVFGADGKRLLARRGDGSAAVLAVKDGAQLHALASSGIVAVAVDRAGNAVLTGLDEVTTWSLASGERLSRHAIASELQHAALADGRRVALDGRAIWLYGQDGAPAAAMARTAEAVVAWAPGGAWDGARELLGFSEALVPCEGAGTRREGLWAAAFGASR